MANFLKSLFVKGVEIDTAGAITGDVLKYNGSKFGAASAGGGSSVGDLDDLTDVSLPSPQSGEFLGYNGSLWVSRKVVTASDTAPASPYAGQLWFKSDTGNLLVYYDSYWIDAAAPAYSTLDGGTA